MKLTARVLVTLSGVALSSAAFGSVLNFGPSGTAYGTQSASTQGLPSAINSYSIQDYYGSTGTGITGNEYITWGSAKTVQSIRWIGSGADASRKLAAFTVSQLTGTDPTDPGSWTAIPDATVSGNTATVVTLNLASAVSTKGIRLDYAGQTTPITGELEIFDQRMASLPASMTAINDIFGAPANAYDGNLMTRWGSASLAGGPGWIEADFAGGAQRLGGVRFRFSVQGGYYDAPQVWRLQAWDSGNSQWMDFAVRSNWSAGADLFEADLASPISTTKVRLYADTPRTTANFPAGSLGVAELELVRAPEPASLVLLAAGGLLALRRRK